MFSLSFYEIFNDKLSWSKEAYVWSFETSFHLLGSATDRD